MFDFIPQEYEKLVNIIFLTITALVAHHALTYRNKDGKKDFVRIPKSYRSLINALEGEIVFEKESLIKEILTNVIENQIQNAK